MHTVISVLVPYQVIWSAPLLYKSNDDVIQKYHHARIQYIRDLIIHSIHEFCEGINKAFGDDYPFI